MHFVFKRISFSLVRIAIHACRSIVSRKNFSLLRSSRQFLFPSTYVRFNHVTTSSFFPSVSWFLFALLFSLSLLLFAFISRKLEPRRPPIITGEIIKKAGAGEILKRWREGSLLSAGRYRLTAMLGSTSYPLCIFVSLLHPRVSSFLLHISLLLCFIPFCIHNRFYVTDSNYLATSFFPARLR